MLCMGQHCNQGGRAEPFYERLRQAFGEIAPAWGAPRPVRWEIANCLSMCDDGPNLVIYPERICYHHLDQELLDRIIEDA